MEKKLSNYTIINKELNSFFAKIGKTTKESVPSPTTLFHLHLKDRSAVHFVMQPPDIIEIINVVQNTK